MKIEHKILADKIYLLIFETQKELTSTFLRFQEHYESPKFRGKFFSLNEFKKWYIKNSPNGVKTGKFTYCSDWNGFNIPSYILKPFYKNKFNPLSQAEKKILQIFKNEKNNFYIIGIHKEFEISEKVLKHEMAHGLFYVNANYKNEVVSVLSVFNTEKIKKELRLKAGYHEEVFEDEINAYSIISGKKLKTPFPKKMRKELKKIYKKYSYKKEFINYDIL